jgi:hypothetical protein
MAVLFGELQMVGSTFLPQHDPVEPRVILEPVEDCHAEAIAVEAQERIEIVSGARNPKRGNRHFHRSIDLKPSLGVGA